MKIRKLIGILSFISFLPSCSIGKDYHFKKYSFSPLNETDISFDKEDSYRSGEYLPSSNAAGSFTNVNDLLKASGYSAIPSIGERKMLVVPVDFVDYPSSNLPKNSLDLIKGAFFGSDSINQFYSVSSFFEKSSYGRLHIDGEVTSWIRSDIPYAELKNYPLAKSKLKLVRGNIVTKLKEAYGQEYLDQFQFEYGGVKHLPIYLIYSAPTGERGTMMWAFTINDPDPTAWSSFDLIRENKGKVDSHTYIHECGHMFGLDDYYDTDSNYFGTVSPTGRMDMMDYSIGDETAFSKMLMNWTYPIVPKKSTTITLRPFSQSGDLILLSSNWNKSLFDEYILLEFYTPHYINKVDSSYRKEGYGLPSRPGLKIYHVSGELNATTPEFMNNNNCPYILGDYVNDSKDHLLYHLLDGSSKSGKLITNFVASDVNKKLKDGSNLRDALLHQGDSFTKNWDLSFYDNSKNPGFEFKINEMTSTYCKIELIKY